MLHWWVDEVEVTFTDGKLFWRKSSSSSSNVSLLHFSSVWCIWIIVKSLFPWATASQEKNNSKVLSTLQMFNSNWEINTGYSSNLKTDKALRVNTDRILLGTVLLLIPRKKMLWSMHVLAAYHVKGMLLGFTMCIKKPLIQTIIWLGSYRNARKS